MKKILIIEDDTDTQKLYRKILTENNFRVYVASSGLTGLKLAKAQKPDLIILDILLPDPAFHMSGLEVVRRLRHMKEMAGIPILVLTNMNLADVAPIDGVVEYAEKVNISLETFLEKVKFLTSPLYAHSPVPE